jgi:hypothetical protein
MPTNVVLCIASIQSRQVQQIFLFSKAPRPNFGPTQPAINWELVSLEVKELGHDTDPTPPSSAKVKNSDISTWPAQGQIYLSPMHSSLFLFPNLNSVFSK